MLKVVCDTNVIVSAFLKSKGNPALIVSLILQKRLTLCLSTGIFSEYQGVLSYGKFKSLDQAVIKDILSRLKKGSLWIDPKVSLDIIKEHPDDNKFLECALEAKADFLITGNTNHFSFQSFQKIQIATPGDFLHRAATAILG